MNRTTIEDALFPDCPIRNILSRLCDKWSLLVIYTLNKGENGKLRFKELQREIPDISQKMLTVTLRTLEEDGYLVRRIYPEIPPIPKNAEQEKENQRFFFKLELDRLIEANNLAKSDKDVFMDRSVLEILSVAYSFEGINKWKGIYENAEQLYKKFISEANKNGIKLPDKYIWLQASSEEVIRRNKLREIERGQKLSENYWVESSLINKQIEFFTRLCTPENKDKIQLIDTDNITAQDV